MLQTRYFCFQNHELHCLFSKLFSSNISGLFPKIRYYDCSFICQKFISLIPTQRLRTVILKSNRYIFLPSWCTYVQVWEPVESWLFQNKPVSFPTKKGDSSRLFFLPKPSLTFPMAQFSTGHCTKSNSRPNELLFLREKWAQGLF